MKMPLEMAWTFPEFDEVIIVSIKEVIEVWKNSGWHGLKWMTWRIKDFLSHVNGISDNNDFWNII